MSDKLKVLVTGVTGKQGGAVAAALGARGHSIRGLTRSLDSDGANAASAKGYELFKGDLSDGASLAPALDGVDAVFAMSTPFEAGMEAEVKQGINIANAAREAGVYLVYTSVAGADRETKIPHFDSKYAVEEHIRTTDIPHVIIAPVYFMENLYFPQTLDALKGGTYATPLPPDRALQQVAVADIGAFGAHVIENRESFLGKRIEIASDETNGADQAALLGVKMGRDVGYFEVPLEQIRSFSEDMAIMYQWFIDVGYSVDTTALRRDYPDIGWHTLKGWIDAQQL